MNSEKSVEAAQAQLAAIVATSDDAIISKTLDGIITSWNKSAERIFGWKADEAVGKHITIIIPHELLDEETTIISKIRRGEHIDHYQTVRMTKDGRRIYVSLTISSIKNREGEIIGASKIARDVTEKVEMEQRKDDFLNMVSHELKTPLTSMKMYLELLKKQTAKVSEKNSLYLIDKITNQTDKLQEIVMDLMDVSAIETGKLQLREEEFNLQDIIVETIETVQPITTKHTILFNGDVLIKVTADRYRLYQVLTNLLTNAIKYSPDGGDIIVSLRKKSKEIILSVQDQGIGISPHQEEKIFQKLYQVPGKKEKTFPGLGMGLYISKEIIKRHNGKIWVESNEGKGSTFYVSLPSD